MSSDIKTIWQIIKSYFNALPDKENEKETVDAIINEISFRGSKLWVLIFAIFIASLGLNVNSTAVIIGAMLISPLMGPIIGMGLAIGINDLDLLKRSGKNYVVATVISVITASVYFFISPLSEAQSELLARTSPTLYDVLIALCGGAAGILALSTKGKGNVIPGVAIATALMPPLCTAGFGVATGNISYFFGAFYLFFINTVFICLATFLGVRMLKFSPKEFIDTARQATVRKSIIAIVIVTMLPAAFFTVKIIKQSVFNTNLSHFMRNEMTFKGTQIIANQVDENSHTIRIVAIGKQISKATLAQSQKQLGKYGLEKYKINLIQGASSDSFLQQHQMATATQTTQDTQNRLLLQAEQIEQLSKQLNTYTQYEKATGNIRNELKVLYPQVKTVSIAKTLESNTDSAGTRPYVVAVVGLRNNTRLLNADRQRLHDWIKARVKADSLRLITTNL
ncbi:MAG TPA: TIGR00341 family protein [Prevotella sp.]